MRAYDDDLVGISALSLGDDIVRDTVLGERVDIQLADQLLPRCQLLNQLQAVGKRDRPRRHDVGHRKEAAIEDGAGDAL